MDNNLINKLKCSLLQTKFLKTSIQNDQKNLTQIEFEAFFYTLARYKIIDTIYDLEILEAINIGINNAITKSNEINLKVDKPLISLSLYLTNKNLFDIINILELINSKNLNISIIELHLCDLKTEEVDNFLNELMQKRYQFLFSISISRKALSNSAIAHIIQNFYEKINKNFIIEIDEGVSFKESSSKDSELQIIATADIINKDLRKKEQKFRRIPLIISCNEFLKIKTLAYRCEVDFNGININKGLKYIEDIKDLNYKQLSNKSLKEILSLAHKI